MPFEIKYGAWIGGTHEDKVFLVTIEEQNFKEVLRRAFGGNGVDVDGAINLLKREILEQLRRG